MPSLALNVWLKRGAAVRPRDYPVMRRDLLQEDEFFILQEDGSSKIVITLGTYDVMLLEDGSKILQEDSDKFILTVY